MYFSVRKSARGIGRLWRETTTATDSVEKKKDGAERGGMETQAKDVKNHHAGPTDTHTHTHMLLMEKKRMQDDSFVM